MRVAFILVFLGFLSYSKPLSAQSRDSSYYKGNLPLIKKTVRQILRKFAPAFDTTYSILAIIEINTKGKLENLWVTTYKCSTIPTELYDVLLATKNEWANQTNANLYYALPIYITHINDSGV